MFSIFYKFAVVQETTDAVNWSKCKLMDVLSWPCSSGGGQRRVNVLDQDCTDALVLKHPDALVFI